MSSQKRPGISLSLSSRTLSDCCILGLTFFALFLTNASPVSTDSLTAVKSKIYFVPGKDFEISWYYNVSRGSRIPETVKIWAHLNNGSTESSLLWTVMIKELDNGLDVATTENKKLATNLLFRIFHGKTQLRHDSIGYTHRYDLLISMPPANTSLYDFSCAVSLGVFARFEKKVKIVRAVKPKIISSFNDNISIRKGERINLICVASGVPVPRVMWTRLYDQGPKIQARGLEKASLIISNIQPESTGTYICVSTNLGGEVKKDVAVTVSYLEIDATYGRLHRGQLGKPLRVDCPILGYPEPDYSWLRGGSLYSSSKSLSFDQLSKEDFGNYTCTAFNPVGQIGTFVLVENMRTVVGNREGNGGSTNSPSKWLGFLVVLQLIMLTITFS